LAVRRVLVGVGVLRGGWAHSLWTALEFSFYLAGISLATGEFAAGGGDGSGIYSVEGSVGALDRLLEPDLLRGSRGWLGD